MDDSDLLSPSLCDSQNEATGSAVPRIPRHGPIFHLPIIKIWQMKKNTDMHFEEESIIYI